jgi:hypothetical protein
MDESTNLDWMTATSNPGSDRTRRSNFDRTLML